MQILPWLVAIAGSLFCLWLGLRVGIRFSPQLANVPWIGVGSTATLKDRMDRMEALMEKLANK
jgi:hypothetical protein